MIELDGAQHSDPENYHNDCVRDRYLKEKGITVLRYKNKDVQVRFMLVEKDILTHLGLENSETYEYIKKKIKEKEELKKKRVFRGKGC